MERRAFLKSTGAVALAQAMQGQPSDSKITSSVMIWTLKGPFEKRLEVASQAGVESVELVSEHSEWTDVQIREMKKLAASLHLKMDTIIGQMDWKHRPVTMVKPEDREGFLADVRQAIVFAQKLEIPQIILMSGDDVVGRTHEEQYSSMLESVKRAGDLAAKANLTLIIEPLNNKVDHKGFFLSTCGEGLKLVKESQNPHVKLLFDIYHEQVQVGNVIRTMKEAAPHVAVFHIADNPGRNDPGTGEMNYENIYKAIASFGYKGYVTMEYLPVGDQTASLTRATKNMRTTLPLSRSV
jgi:hydroxypyruvate isomerase